MKKAKVFLACLGVIATILFVGTAPAYSSGYPVLGLYTPSSPGDVSVVVVGKFDSSDFSLSDVGSYAQSLQGVLGTLGSSLPGIVFMGPNELAQYGFADADNLKNYIKSVYQGVVDIYVFLDVTKVNSPYSAQYGQNVRIDAWVADLAALVGSTDDYLYAASIEVPEIYLSLLSQLSF